jgi:hypothetical protein
MAQFDRFDICEAYLVMEWEWHVGGYLRERPSNIRRGESTEVQLMRMKFKPAPNLCFETLSDNAKEIYFDLCRRYGLRRPSMMEITCPRNKDHKRFLTVIHESAEWLTDEHGELIEYKELVDSDGPSVESPWYCYACPDNPAADVKVL